jgi:riboflavin kinase/FMN adenylyltransferase
MLIVESTEDVPQSLGRTVVSVGNFDGVHRAHRAVLECMRADAARLGATSVAVTFEPHPLRILRPQTAPRLITPLEEKIRQLEKTGIDLLLILPFSRDLSLLTPSEFIQSVLVNALHAVVVHEGANFRFGHGQAGTVAELEQAGRRCGFAVHVHSEMRLGRDVVSSSRIRELVEAGDVNRARRLLGRCFAVRGPIAQGHGVGRKLTVPTLNLQHYEELLPRRGVYVTQTVADSHEYNSVTNVGVRPTFQQGTAGSRDGSAVHHPVPMVVESHLLGVDRSAELEIDEMEVRFLHRLRDERKFASPELLKQQILRDVARAQRYFAAVNQRLGIRD